MTFDILTDLHLKTAEQFRLVFIFPDYLSELYKSFGSTLDRFHDEPEYRLPMPARYVLDQQSIIRAADVNADYTIRPEPSETLSRLKALIGDGKLEWNFAYLHDGKSTWNLLISVLPQG